MTLLGDDFRKRAAENNKQAAAFFDSADFKSNPTIQATAVISKVTANTLYLLGELVDYLRTSEAGDATSDRRKQYAERNDAIRKAYAAGMKSGDYTNFDQLIAEFGAGLTGGGEGE